jgi:hypothetical protein
MIVKKVIDRQEVSQICPQMLLINTESSAFGGMLFAAKRYIQSTQNRNGSTLDLAPKIRDGSLEQTSTIHCI